MPKNDAPRIPAMSYNDVLSSLKFGNPFAVESVDDSLPDHDHGPVMSQAEDADIGSRCDVRLGVLLDVVDGHGIGEALILSATTPIAQLME